VQHLLEARHRRKSGSPPTRDRSTRKPTNGDWPIGLGTSRSSMAR
jgi:hypothetical protein